MTKLKVDDLVKSSKNETHYYNGIPLTDFEKEELIAIIVELGRAMQSQTSNHIKVVDYFLDK